MATASRKVKVHSFICCQRIQVFLFCVSSSRREEPEPRRTTGIRRSPENGGSYLFDVQHKLASHVTITNIFPSPFPLSPPIERNAGGDGQVDAARSPDTDTWTSLLYAPSVVPRYSIFHLVCCGLRCMRFAPLGTRSAARLGVLHGFGIFAAVLLTARQLSRKLPQVVFSRPHEIQICSLVRLASATACRKRRGQTESGRLWMHATECRLSGGCRRSRISIIISPVP